MKILICIILNKNNIGKEFFLNFIDLYTNLIKQFNTKIIIIENTIEEKNSIISYFNYINFDKLIFTDSYLVINHENIINSLNKNLDFIVAPIPTGNINYENILNNKNIEDIKVNINNYDLCLYNDNNELIKNINCLLVYKSNLDFFIIDIKLVKKLIENYKHTFFKTKYKINNDKYDNFLLFDTIYDHSTNLLENDNDIFCKRVRNINEKIYCDLDLHISKISENFFNGNIKKFLNNLKT